jgi:hypothetical protein
VDKIREMENIYLKIMNTKKWKAVEGFRQPDWHSLRRSNIMGSFKPSLSVKIIILIPAPFKSDSFQQFYGVCFGRLIT